VLRLQVCTTTSCCPSFLFVLGILKFELRALHRLGKCSTTWATLQPSPSFLKDNFTTYKIEGGIPKTLQILYSLSSCLHGFPCKKLHVFPSIQMMLSSSDFFQDLFLFHWSFLCSWIWYSWMQIFCIYPAWCSLSICDLVSDINFGESFSCGWFKYCFYFFVFFFSLWYYMMTQAILYVSWSRLKSSHFSKNTWFILSKKGIRKWRSWWE
jgi:hypothetical protein